ncbi:HDOD domain-containing protein [Bdellovibrionota bacterium FG-2]
MSEDEDNNEDGSEDNLRILTKYIEKMPTFSPATSKIIQLANKLNTSPNEIVAAIRLDPILTGRVLQLVNSAYFSLAQRVTSLNRAVVYLGINTIKNLALSTAVLQTFENKNKELAELVKPVWRHSLATAVCAKIIAKASAVPVNMLEEYFIAGLLHDIGKTILMQAFFETQPHDGKISAAEEKSRYSLDHSELGAQTLKKWNFHEQISEAVFSHHTPVAQNKISYILQLADSMTYRLGLNGEQEESEKQTRPVDPDTWKVLGIEEARVLRELETAQEQIEKAEVFLNIASSKEKVVEKLEGKT